MYAEMNERNNRLELQINTAKHGHIPVRITPQPLLRQQPHPQSPAHRYPATTEQSPVAEVTHPPTTMVTQSVPVPTANSPHRVTRPPSPPISTVTDVAVDVTSRRPAAASYRPGTQMSPNQSSAQVSSSQTPPNNNNTLVGFTRVGSSKPRYAAYYVGGVVAKATDTLTLTCVSDYICSKLGFVRSVRKLKDAGNTTSFKVVVCESDTEVMDSGVFWPKGIMCRKWIDNS